jgi:hypothetical protein
MGPARPKIEQLAPNMHPIQAEHRTYGFISWNSRANTLVQAVVVAKRPELYNIQTLQTTLLGKYSKNPFSNKRMVSKRKTQ